MKLFVSLRHRFRHHIRQSGVETVPASQDLTGYFAAACALRSDLPAVRRPAITALLQLARQTTGPIRANAERVLTEEFGPYAVTEGMSPCSAPIRLVEECDGNCGSCAWLWLDPQPIPEEPATAVPSFAGALPGFL